MKVSLKEVASFLLVVALLASMGLGAQAAPVLVADYTFSDASNLGADASGKGNAATIIRNVTQVAGPTAGSFAARFNQFSFFEKAGGLAGYTDSMAGFAFVAWVKVDGSYSGYNGIVSQDFGGCCVNRLLLANGTTPFINVGAHDDRVLAGAVEPLNSWYQIAMTGQTVGGGSVGHVYVNGVEVAGSPQTFNYAQPDLTGVNTYLGAGENGAAYRLSGDLADVRIYQGALSPSDVLALYNGTATTTAVDEPGMAWVLAAGVIGLGVMGRRRVG